MTDLNDAPVESPAWRESQGLNTDLSNEYIEDEEGCEHVLVSTEYLKALGQYMLDQDHKVVVLDQKITWLCQQMQQLTQMLAGVQQAASMMGGPMGKMAQKLMSKNGGNPNG